MTDVCISIGFHIPFTDAEKPKGPEEKKISDLVKDHPFASMLEERGKQISRIAC